MVPFTMLSMSKLSRSEIHLKALRAAAAVSLFGGTLACGTVDPQNLSPQVRDTGSVQNQYVPDSGSQVVVDSGSDPVDLGTMVRMDAGFVDTGVSPDTGTAQPDAMVMADMGVRVDMGNSVSDAGTPDAGACTGFDIQTEWEAYAECCREHNWDPSAGCSAWGPSAPPSMVEVV